MLSPDIFLLLVSIVASFQNEAISFFVSYQPLLQYIVFVFDSIIEGPLKKAISDFV